MRVSFIITIFVGALLLFLVQPMVGKILLPLLGGTPAVWNICMLFFQAMLLAGYAYAHLLTKLRDSRWQIVVHAIVMAAALIALPIALRSGSTAPTDGSPMMWLLGALLLSVGLPFFVVSTSSPLLQRWFATTGDPSARDPYFLYAASNAGSLLALLAYPLLVEPLLSLEDQRTTWSVGYGAFLVLTMACGVAVLRRVRSGGGPVGADAPEPPAPPPPSRRDYAKWVMLAFVPSSLMLGATQHITTDVAAIPLFWVIPLAIYLLTFVLAFSRRKIICLGLSNRMLNILTFPVLAISARWSSLPVSMILGLHFMLLFFAAMMCHGRLAESRPHPRFLTAFFLAIAVGGSLGGIFNAIIAPWLFDTVLEYPLLIAVAFFLRNRQMAGQLPPAVTKWVHRGLDFGVLAMTAAYVPLYTFLPGVDVVEMERTFFGVHWVVADEDQRWTAYYQGTTLHGIQMADDPGRSMGYYHDDTGIGQVYLRLAGDPRLERVGIVGLGTGALAARIEPGQHHTFYEIDPAVVRIARNPDLFTYLSDAREPPSIVLGDGRLSLAREPDDQFGMIVIDAFSSDAIPAHLLTTEAIDLYFRKLVPDGLLIIHVTNRHLDLGRLVAGLARDRGLILGEWMGAYEVEPSFDEGRFDARWLVMARDLGAFAPLLADPRWQPVVAPDDAPVWTDDYSNLLTILKWF